MQKMENNDLISRSALTSYINETHPYAGLPMAAYICTMELLTYAPTVDAVEVVRCKDCQHWHEETGWCNQHSHFIGADGEACHPWESANWKMFEPDDFCSYGEKREVV